MRNQSRLQEAFTRWFLVGALFIGAVPGCQQLGPVIPNSIADRLPRCTDAALRDAAARAVTTSPKAADELPCVTELGAHAPVNESGQLQSAHDQSATDLLEAVERPYLKAIGIPDGKAQLGLALAGGGSKASAMAMGVLAGFADADAISKLDMISSVSGGGYAAYFLYAHTLHPGLVNSLPDSTKSLFSDCVSPPPRLNVSFAKPLKERMALRGECSKGDIRLNPNEGTSPSLQAYVRCKQDVLDPWRCSALDSAESSGTQIGLYLGWLASLPFGAWHSILFDTGVRSSYPSLVYRQGIGMAYGTRPAQGFVLPSKQDSDFWTALTRVTCASDATRDQVGGLVAGCTNGFLGPDPIGLSFESLRVGLLNARVADPERRLPFWIINATAVPYRSGFGWYADKSGSAFQDTFELTPVSHGSGRFGYVSSSAALHGLTSLEAVAASAAFFDANELVLSKIFRAVAGPFQHAANLNWGYDIWNYNTSKERFQTHTGAPFPFYLIDRFRQSGGGSSEGGGDESLPLNRARFDRERSALIRLIDGGSADNLGLLSLERRNVAHIVVSDHAQDGAGVFGDLCNVRAQMLARPEPPNAKAAREHPERYRRHLIVPGLTDFEAMCRGERRNGYDLWSLSVRDPVFLGCIRQSPPRKANATDCDALAQNDIRLYVIKPAINEAHWRKTALEVASGPPWSVNSCWLPDDPLPTAGLNELPLPCESLLYLLSQQTSEAKRPVFPQHSTVMMTADSDPWRYGAYRELGRQYGRLAVQIALEVQAQTRIQQSADKSLFDEILSRQRAHPLPLK